MGTKNVKSATGKPADHREYTRWIRAGFDERDVAVKINGDIRRDTNDKKEQSLNAQDWRGRIAKVAVKTLAAHRQGISTLYGAPVKTQGIIRIRFDADAHHGELDAGDCITALSNEFFAGQLFHEQSERGHVGYVDIILPRLPWHGPIEDSPNRDGTYYESAARINATMDHLQASLRQWASAHGFTCQIEVNGRLEVRAREVSEISAQPDQTPWTETSPPAIDIATMTMPETTTRTKIVKRGQTMKLPRCKNIGDVAKLVASRFEWEVIGRMIQAGKVEQTATPAPQPKPQSFARKTASGRTRLENAGDKNLNRWNCCREIALPYLGTVDRFTDLPEQLRESMVRDAIALYTANGFAGGANDAAREKAFIAKFKKLFETHKPDFHSTYTGSEIHYDELIDFRAAEVLLRSTVSKQRLARMNAERGLIGRITYQTLAMTLVFAVKNANTQARSFHKNDVPVKSLIGFHAYYAHTVNGTFTRCTVELFRELGFIHGSLGYSAGHHPRRMTIAGKARELPFAHHLYEDDLRAEAAAQTTPGRGAGDSIPTTYNSPMQCMLEHHYPTTDTDPACEPQFITNLTILSIEIMERQKYAMN